MGRESACEREIEERDRARERERVVEEFWRGESFDTSHAVSYDIRATYGPEEMPCCPSDQLVESLGLFASLRCTLASLWVVLNSFFLCLSL